MIQQLRLAGSDMSKPHSTEFFVYCPEQDQVSAAERAIAALGYRTEISPKDDELPWGVIAAATFIPTSQEVRRRESQLEVAASDAGCSYDGWEAAVVR